MQRISMHRISIQMVRHQCKSLQRVYRALMIVNDQYKKNQILIPTTIFLMRKRVHRKRQRFLKKLLNSKLILPELNRHQMNHQRTPLSINIK